MFSDGKSVDKPKKREYYMLMSHYIFSIRNKSNHGNDKKAKKGSAEKKAMGK
jgi:hypothetical protein